MTRARSASASGHSAEGVDLAEIERLLQFMEKHGLEEFEYKREGLAHLAEEAFGACAAGLCAHAAAGNRGGVGAPCAGACARRNIRSCASDGA